MLLECVEGAGRGLGDGHRRRLWLILALADRDACCAARPKLDVALRQGCSFRPVTSDRRWQKSSISRQASAWLSALTSLTATRVPSSSRTMPE